MRQPGYSNNLVEGRVRHVTIPRRPDNGSLKGKEDTVFISASHVWNVAGSRKGQLKGTLTFSVGQIKGQFQGLRRHLKTWLTIS